MFLLIRIEAINELDGYIQSNKRSIYVSGKLLVNYLYHNKDYHVYVFSTIDSPEDQKIFKGAIEKSQVERKTIIIIDEMQLLFEPKSKDNPDLKYKDFWRFMKTKYNINLNYNCCVIAFACYGSGKKSGLWPSPEQFKWQVRLSPFLTFLMAT